MTGKMTDSKNIRGRNADMNRQIDENLKRAFNEVAEEPIPAQLTELLEKLRQSGGSETEGGASSDE